MWILAAGVMGLAGNVTSVGGAAMVLGLGLVPPILLMLRRSHARQAVSEATGRTHNVRPTKVF